MDLRLLLMLSFRDIKMWPLLKVGLVFASFTCVSMKSVVGRVSQNNEITRVLSEMKILAFLLC